jgi:hypothetical protein
MSDARRRAKSMNVEFTLTKAWFIEKLQAGRCERSGILFDYEPGSPWVPSPDRLNSTIGYTPTNCQMVCWI